MTREQASLFLKDLVDVIDYQESENDDFLNARQALKMAIKALEQEPKIGHWIYDYEYSDWFDVTYECSCCKRTIIVPYEAKNEVYKDYPYCHCGAKMAESEDKE